MEKDDILYPIFLERTEGKKVGDESFPGYYVHRYEADPEKLLNKALEEEHLVESDYKFNMYETTNAELKDVLREYDLKVSGVKDELVKRLLNNLEEEELKSIFDQSYYQLSGLGKEIVRNNQHLIYYHKSLDSADISIKDYHETFNSNDELDKYEAAVKLIKKNRRKHRENGDWGLYRNTFLSTADIYSDSGDIKKALELYLTICHMDLTGLSNGNIYNPGTIFLAPGIISRLKKAISNLDYNTDALKNLYFEIAEELELPKTTYSKEKSFEYISRAIDEGAETVTEKLEEENESSIERLDDHSRKEKQEPDLKKKETRSGGSGCTTNILIIVIVILLIMYLI